MANFMHLPNKGNEGIQNKTILAVDIGGTKTNLGLFVVEGDKLRLLREGTFSSRGYDTFGDIVRVFLNDPSDGGKPYALSIGVAGPVLDHSVKLTNLSWELDANGLSSETGINRVVIINDLEATAYGMAGLDSEDIVALYDVEELTQGNIAILAPGTGLGQAGLFWDGEAHRPFATEGGHSDFAPRTELDFEFLNYLKQEADIVSWEYVVSGPGILRIYKFLRDVKGHKETGWLTENFRKNENAPSVISHAALRELDATCIKTMDMFVSYMAREAASLVLKHKATGGLYLGGGIPPRIYPILRKDLFREQFIQNAKMTDLLRKVPINIILNSKAALLGAAYYGAFGAHY